MKFSGLAALAVMAVAAVPAQAVLIAPGASGLTPTPFATIAATQGVELVTREDAGFQPFLTFTGFVRSAVYRNTLGTLDFYYQAYRTGPGSISNDEIETMTAGPFNGFTVDGYVSAADPDGAGFFTAVNNPNPPIGSTTTFGRSNEGGGEGNVLRVQFGDNGLFGTENSATYIFRTNATQYKVGTTGLIDGATISGLSFAPSGVVPEPATWAMMISGFGLVGYAMRSRRRRTTSVTA